MVDQMPLKDLRSICGVCLQMPCLRYVQNYTAHRTVCNAGGITNHMIVLDGVAQ